MADIGEFLENLRGQDAGFSQAQKDLARLQLDQQKDLKSSGGGVMELFGPGFTGGTDFTNLDAVVPFNQDQLASMASRRGAATSAGDLLPSINQGLLFGLNDVMDIANNPYAQGAIQAAIDPVTEAIINQIIPAAKSAGIDQGAFGGARDAFVTAQVIDDALTGARRSADTLAGQFYNTGVGAYIDALSQAPSILGLQGIPADYLQQVGDTIAERDNILRAQDIAEHDFERDAPFARASQFANIIDTLYEPPERLLGVPMDQGDLGVAGDVADVLGMLEFLGINVGQGTTINVTNTIEDLLDSVIEGGDTILENILDIFAQGGQGGSGGSGGFGGLGDIFPPLG